MGRASTRSILGNSSWHALVSLQEGMARTGATSAPPGPTRLVVQALARMATMVSKPVRALSLLCSAGTQAMAGGRLGSSTLCDAPRIRHFLRLLLQVSMGSLVGMGGRLVTFKYT
jgi:hypothetical protein